MAEEHLDDVYRYLLYMTGNPHLAEDLAAETFERALKRWRRFDPRRGAARTWLCQLARGTALDHFRAEQPPPTARGRLRVRHPRARRAGLRRRPLARARPRRAQPVRGRARGRRPTRRAGAGRRDRRARARDQADRGLDAAQPRPAEARGEDGERCPRLVTWWSCERPRRERRKRCASSFERCLRRGGSRRSGALRPRSSPRSAIAVAVAVGAAAIGGIDGSSNCRPSGGSRSVSFESRSTRARCRSTAPRIPRHGAAAPRRDRAAPAGTREVAAPAPGRLDEPARQGPLRRNPERGPHDPPARRLRRRRRLLDRRERPATRASTSACRSPNLQQAIARFTDLGTILSQHISVADLQARRSTGSTSASRTRAARQVDEKTGRRASSAGAPRSSARAPTRRSRSSSRRRKPAAKHVVPSRFDRFRDNAGDILGKEAIAVLYALVIAGPFILLAALALLGERARRRRADHRLLEETG